jgi:hypothetical protein
MGHHQAESLKTQKKLAPSPEDPRPSMDVATATAAKEVTAAMAT